MKVFPEVLTSASSGIYNWSEVLDMTRHAKERNFTLEWDIETSATTVDFAWSGSSNYAGIYTRSATLIDSGVTSGSGPLVSGSSNVPFTPQLFPFMKIGGKATGTTSTISVSLIVE